MEYVEEIPKEWKVDADFELNHHYLFEPLFSEEQCDKIIDIGERLVSEDATITDKANVTKNIRNSTNLSFQLFFLQFAYSSLYVSLPFRKKSDPKLDKIYFRKIAVEIWGFSHNLPLA